MADLGEEIRRGNEARMILEHPLFLDAFRAIEDSLNKAWKTSNVRDTEGREFIFLAQKALDQVKGYLATHVETGKMAEMQLQEENRVVN